MHTVRTVKGIAVNYTVSAARGSLHVREGGGIIEGGSLHIRHRWYGTEILIIPPNPQSGVAEVHRCVHGVALFFAAVAVAAVVATVIF